jgi:hypothetical protein
VALAPRSTLSLIAALDLPVVNWDRGERIVAVLVPLSRRAAAADGRDHKRGKENGGGPARHRVIIDMALAKSMPVAFVGLAFASTALAADVDLHGFGREVWLSKSSAAHVIHLKAPPALRIVVGGETLELERTTLPTSSSASGVPSIRGATLAIRSIGSATTMLQRAGPCGSSLTKWAGATKPSWRWRWPPTGAVIRMAALGLRRPSRT